VTTFVLVHGAFRGGWAWDRVRPILEAAGHTVHAPSLTGMGDRVHLRPADGGAVRLATWTEDLVALFRTHDLRDVVLVGHSQGGMVLAAAADDLHDRVARLVFLDAPVPQDGERGIDLNPPGIPTPRPEDVDLSASLPPRPVGSDDGFDAETAAWVNERLSGTPIGPSFEPVAVGDAGAALPRQYVFFSRTPETFPCWSTRARLTEAGEPFVVVDAHHDAPLTDPTAVAELLVG
jgi:pimeloyl-ACP methyl ester carboxylesterase